VAAALKGVAVVGAVNCDEHQGLCAEHGCARRPRPRLTHCLGCTSAPQLGLPVCGHNAPGFTQAGSPSVAHGHQELVPNESRRARALLARLMLCPTGARTAQDSHCGPFIAATMQACSPACGRGRAGCRASRP